MRAHVRQEAVHEHVHTSIQGSLVDISLGANKLIADSRRMLGEAYLKDIIRPPPTGSVPANVAHPFQTSFYTYVTKKFIPRYACCVWMMRCMLKTALLCSGIGISPLEQLSRSPSMASSIHSASKERRHHSTRRRKQDSLHVSLA